MTPLAPGSPPTMLALTTRAVVLLVLVATAGLVLAGPLGAAFTAASLLAFRLLTLDVLALAVALHAHTRRSRS